MFNKIIIIGNLTRDVELKYLPSGSAAATIGLASNRKFKKQDGTMTDETCFVDVKLFGRTAEVANQYLKKGSQVLIEGRLVLETWNDATGAKRNKHSIVAENMQMLGRAYSDTSNHSDNNSMQEYQNDSITDNKKNIQIEIDEDEIPF